jgi:hypothetical protein
VLNTFTRADAILTQHPDGTVTDPEWPKVDFIVSNPPFLGDKLMRSRMGDDYVTTLRAHYDGRVPGGADLCCYWFEKARAAIEAGRCTRAGLLATQGIRGGKSREVLQQIKQTGDIFFAISDREWVLDGANVHVSMVGFDRGSDGTRLLDGHVVAVVNSDLTSGADITRGLQLSANLGVSFMGDTKVGPFDSDFSTVRDLVFQPNVDGRPNSDVLRPWVNGLDLTSRLRHMWIVDFPPGMAQVNAARYEAPFEHAVAHVRPMRAVARSGDATGVPWWIHQRPRPEMRRALATQPRYLGTPRVAKHRLFVWLSPEVLPDAQLIVFARDDDYFFGVVHSRIHELWALEQGTQLESRPRYTPTTCFETFPFPSPNEAQREAIAAAAKELNTLRSRWLNPPEWVKEDVLEFPASVDGPWARMVTNPNNDGIGTARYVRLVPIDDKAAAALKKRTLTNLYNDRPAWLANAHRTLDEAVFAAYGWPPSLTDDELLAKLLDLNLAQSASEKARG